MRSQLVHTLTSIRLLMHDVHLLPVHKVIITIRVGVPVFVDIPNLKQRTAIPTFLEVLRVPVLRVVRAPSSTVPPRAKF